MFDKISFYNTFREGENPFLFYKLEHMYNLIEDIKSQIASYQEMLAEFHTSLNSEWENIIAELQLELEVLADMTEGL